MNLKNKYFYGKIIIGIEVHMVYKYNPNIVNMSNDFNDKKNFVGYILPDGSIFPCVEHNVSNVYSFFKLYLDLLDKDYDKRDEILNVETDNKLAKIVLYKLKTMSYDEVHAFNNKKNESLMGSDFFVSFFGCHLVTRLRKLIITSELNHQCFYNYLLHGFKIMTIPKVMFNQEKKEYQFVSGKDRNEYLYDEIDKIRSEIKDEEIELFHK